MAADEKVLLRRTREMRNDPTSFEKMLWRHLSNSQLGGYKFRRQAVVETYICDFLCPAKARIVEVDGDTHDQSKDAKRDAVLFSKSYVTIRFTNSDVSNNLEGVLTSILEKLHALPDRWPHPNPSPEGEGLSS